MQILRIARLGRSKCASRREPSQVENRRDPSQVENSAETLPRLRTAEENRDIYAGGYIGFEGNMDVAIAP